MRCVCVAAEVAGQSIARAEARRSNTPYRINWIGLGMTAPALRVHGSEKQKKRILRKILHRQRALVWGLQRAGRAVGSRGACAVALILALTGSLHARRKAEALRGDRDNRPTEGDAAVARGWPCPGRATSRVAGVRSVGTARATAL